MLQWPIKLLNLVISIDADDTTVLSTTILSRTVWKETCFVVWKYVGM